MDTRKSLLQFTLPHLISFSTLKVYANGEAKEYNGPRQADGIISYMVKYVCVLVNTITVNILYLGNHFLPSHP